jgi:hypothetical protein
MASYRSRSMSAGRSIIRYFPRVRRSARCTRRNLKREDRGRVDRLEQQPSHPCARHNAYAIPGRGRPPARWSRSALRDRIWETACAEALGGSTMTWVARWRRATGPAVSRVVARSTSAAAFCIVCKLPISPIRIRASPAVIVAAASGRDGRTTGGLNRSTGSRCYLEPHVPVAAGLR